MNNNRKQTLSTRLNRVKYVKHLLVKVASAHKQTKKKKNTQRRQQQEQQQLNVNQKRKKKNTRKCTTSTTPVPFTQLRKTFAKANKIWIKLCNFQVTCHLQPGKCHSKTISLRRALVFSLFFFFFIHTLISLSLFIADIFSIAAKGLSPHSSPIRKTSVVAYIKNAGENHKLAVRYPNGDEKNCARDKFIWHLSRVLSVRKSFS